MQSWQKLVLLHVITRFSLSRKAQMQMFWQNSRAWCGSKILTWGFSTYKTKDATEFNIAFLSITALFIPRMIMVLFNRNSILLLNLANGTFRKDIFHHEESLKIRCLVMIVTLNLFPYICGPRITYPMRVWNWVHSASNKINKNCHTKLNRISLRSFTIIS